MTMIPNYFFCHQDINYQHQTWPYTWPEGEIHSNFGDCHPQEEHPQSDCG
jgi:hypothetical protein